MPPCIIDEGSDTYKETRYLFEVRTKDGLKGQVYYDVDADGNYDVYPVGDKKYALLAFKIYTYNVANSRAHPPNIRKVGSPGKDLTYLG